MRRNAAREGTWAGTALAVALALVVAPTLGATGAAAAPSKGPRCPDRAFETKVDTEVLLSLRCHGLRRAKIRIVKAPRHGLVGHINQRRDRVLYSSHDRYIGADRLVVTRSQGGRRWTNVVSISVIPAETLSEPPQPPRCGKGDATARYQDAVAVTITCTGEDLAPLRVASGPFSGSLTGVHETGTSDSRTLTATYEPDQLFAGQDALLVDAVSPAGDAYGAAALTVLPWRMRAIGDSVTAGFGYIGGTLMPTDDLLDCKPPTIVNNRCSSNSDAGPSYTGPPAWSDDFGLGNDISWAAQFANDLQGGGHVSGTEMFQNRAVTGSAPSDWLPGGILNKYLAAIVAEDPELVPMTLGANPLLSELLLTSKGEECSLTFTVAELNACVQPFFDHVDLTGSLERVYTALLQAPDTNVVAFQYSLSIPALNLFSTWQLEAMIALFNENIATAVGNTKAHLPAGQAARLFMVEAQVDPADPEPTELPRFNTGLPPTVHDSWTGSYDCGGVFDSDGPSHQSDLTQDFFTASDYDFCTGPPWIIDADSGIHPSQEGYAQYATALTNFAQAEGLIPQLP
jgi:lysophospholipase L1-like esterase